MRIIFLDIDGVLNSHEFFERTQYNRSDFPYSDLNPISIKKLNEIIRRTDASVVVSSMWRFGRAADELQYILENKGFEGRIVSTTPERGCSSCLRGNEILNWIKENDHFTNCKSHREFRSYVILDDDSDMLYWQKDNFVKVNSSRGLSDDDVEKAVLILLQAD